MDVCVLMRIKALCPMLTSDDQPVMIMFQSRYHSSSVTLSMYLSSEHSALSPCPLGLSHPSTWSSPGVISLIAPAVMSKCVCCLYGQFYLLVQCRWCLMVSNFSDVLRVGF